MNTSEDHYLFIISQLRLTSHPRIRSAVVLLDKGTPSTRREIYCEDVDDGTRTRVPSSISEDVEGYYNSYAGNIMNILVVLSASRDLMSALDDTMSASGHVHYIGGIS